MKNQIKITYWTREGKTSTTTIMGIPFQKLHREDGPAIEWDDGDKEWYVNGKCHRIDGPALVYADPQPDGIKEWWTNGRKLPKKEVKDWLEENNIDLSTPEGQMAFKMRWL